jgi:hypothetical protein
MGQASRTQPRHSGGSLAAQLPCDHQATSSLRHAVNTMDEPTGCRQCLSSAQAGPRRCASPRVSGRIYA